MRLLKLAIQLSIILVCAILLVPSSVLAWSGELNGHVNERYIVGAGSLNWREGLSLLGSCRLEDNRRAVFQVKIASSELKPNQAISSRRVNFSESSALEQNASLSYQVYDQNGRLLFNAVAHSGYMEFSKFDGVAVKMNFSVQLQDQAQFIDLSSQDLSLDNVNPEAMESDFVDPNLSPSSTERELNTTSSRDPFVDAYYEDEGCDFDDESADEDLAGYPFYADENESNYDSYYDDDYNSDDDNISCDDSDSIDSYDSDEDSISCDPSDSVDDDYESDDGCTDDEWAAEAKGTKPRAQYRNRKALKRWRALNRILPLLISILMIGIWRALIRIYRTE